MNKLTIDDLKKASEIWSTDGKTIFTENELFHLDSNIIYSEIFAINKNKENIDHCYLPLQKDGWLDDYPIPILIGYNNIKPYINLLDGNHRCACLYKYDLSHIKYIPVNIFYSNIRYEIFNDK